MHCSHVGVCVFLHALFFNMSLLISAAIVDRAPSGRPGRPAACGCATPRSPREAAPAAGRPRRPARDDVDRRATASTVDRASRQPSETAPRAGPRRRQVSRSAASGERHGQRDERDRDTTEARRQRARGRRRARGRGRTHGRFVRGWRTDRKTPRTPNAQRGGRANRRRRGAAPEGEARDSDPPA